LRIALVGGYLTRRLGETRASVTAVTGGEWERIQSGDEPVAHGQRWRLDGDWWGDAGWVWREYIALTTADGMLCVIYFDPHDQTWHLSRVYD
jgi:hypothetical protein